LSVAKQLSYGLAFNAHYTWSHSIDDVYGFGGANDAGVTPQRDNLRANRGNSAFDVRHDLKVDYYYDLPLSSLTALPRPLREGWNIGGITRIDSGNPYTVLTGANVGDQVHGSGRMSFANRVPEPRRASLSGC